MLLADVVVVQERGHRGAMQLADLDITKSDSSRYKMAAEVLESDEGWFDEHVTECGATQDDSDDDN